MVKTVSAMLREFSSIETKGREHVVRIAAGRPATGCYCFPRFAQWESEASGKGAGKRILTAGCWQQGVWRTAVLLCLRLACSMKEGWGNWRKVVKGYRLPVICNI